MNRKLFQIIMGCMVLSCFVPQMSLSQARSYHFDNKGISLNTLENYLARSITMAELLEVDPYENDGPYFHKEDDVRMIKNIGAKFIGRAIYRWGHEEVLNNVDYLENAKRIVNEIHALDKDIIFQAALFEIVTRQVNKIPIPDWAFKALDIMPENRNFKYDSMLNLEGKLVDHWRLGSSVPDITRSETRLWFIFLAGTYFNIGCEALHLGQTALIGMADSDLKCWKVFIDDLRKFATTTTRRGWVLLDAHVPTGGMVLEGVSLLDFNSFPLRIKEKEEPQEAELEVGYSDALFGRSKGAMTPSGWVCKSLPYLVEFDNFGRSRTPGVSTINDIYVWGYDEISWFSLQPKTYRNEWLKYAWNWMKEKDPSGFLEMPGSRIISIPDFERKERRYRANTQSEDCPWGYGQENTIKELWLQGR